MSVGRWIGPGMVVGWHSFTPNERVVAMPGTVDKALAKRLAQREKHERGRPIVRPKR